MDTTTAKELANALLEKFGLLSQGWTFGWNNRKRGFGVCRYGFKRVELSLPLTRLNGAAEVEDTIRHEIAHALAGADAKHGYAWRAQCLVTGARLERCYDSAKVVQPPSKHEAVCPKCGRVVKRNRLICQRMACLACCNKYNGGRFTTDFLLRFQSIESQSVIMESK